MSLIEFPWLVSVEGYKQAEWNEGSSLHRTAEACTAAVLQPGSQWSGEIEPVWTFLTGGKEAGHLTRHSKGVGVVFWKQKFCWYKELLNSYEPVIK